CSIASTCDQAQDCGPARNCQVCALGACFNDPACQREKIIASHNCEVRRAARFLECQNSGAPQRSACERQRAELQAICEIEKSASRLACEAGKEELGRLGVAGNLAQLSGTARGSANFSICMKDVSVEASLERLKASAITGGEGTVDLGIKYLPQQIAGYLDC